MGDNIDSALQEAERVSKKQKTCEVKTSDCISKLIKEITAAREQLALEGHSSHGAQIMHDLNQHLNSMELSSQLVAHTKELHNNVNRLSKAIDKAFIPDICKATRSWEFDKATLNQVLAQHFFQEGRFQVGELFLKEAAVPRGEELRKPFAFLHEILTQIQRHELGAALAWAAQHEQELAASSSSNSFAFKLHRLQFLHLLTSQGSHMALKYARENFHPFKTAHMHEIQSLMGMLCYVKRPHSSPYGELISPSHWQDVAREFVRQCCGLLGLAADSPLLVSISAGALALPTLIKLASVMAAQGQDINKCQQLPVELELGQEFVFRSVFACPVSRDQSTAENPPMLLPCGHVLCKQSILKIAKSPARSFKCPYCPLEATFGTCSQIIFPDIQ